MSSPSVNLFLLGKGLAEPGDREAGRLRVKIANRAIGNNANATEPLVNIALHLAPERAKSLIRSDDVLDDGDAGQRLGGDLLVIGKTHPRRFLPVAGMGFARTDDRG